MAEDQILQLGKTITAKREQLGWSIRELARRTDLNDTTVINRRKPEVKSRTGKLPVGFTK